MKRLNFYLTLGSLIIFGWGCKPVDYQYIDKAIEVESWLSSQKKEIDGYEIWVDEVDKEKASLSLSSGVSGKVLFYLELYLATKNENYLSEALHGCKFINAKLPKTVAEARAIRNATSLYGDISGSTFALMETYKITKDEKWKASVNHCLTLIDSLSDNPDGRYWNNFNDILIGSSGTSLLLLYLNKELNDDRPLKIAKQAAAVLEQRMVKVQDSTYWYINQDNKMNLPNFSHGAAGIGYFYACLYEVTKDSQYLDMAKQVANYLDLIAWKPDDSFLLPYGFPDYGWTREYDIGWAHGPAGTARFFFKLWQVTNDSKWLETVKQCSKGIKFSGFPDKPNEHFGETSFPTDMRFGLGGVLDFNIGLAQNHLIEVNDLYLTELINKLDEKSLIDAPNKRYWEIARYGFMGGKKGSPVTYTGYFYGASGLGLQYIKLHNLINGKGKGIMLPDNPF